MLKNVPRNNKSLTRTTSEFLEATEILDATKALFSWNELFVNQNVCLFIDEEDFDYANSRNYYPRNVKLGLKFASKEANGIIKAMNLPRNVTVTVKPPDHEDKGATAYANNIFIPTYYFDDEELTVFNKIDCLLGYSVHEACHILYTDYSLKLFPEQVKKHLANLIEDARIEDLLATEKPFYAVYIASLKYFVFDREFLKLQEERSNKNSGVKKLSKLEKFLTVFFAFIRYPKYVRRDFYDEVEHEIKYSLEVLSSYENGFPNNTTEVFEATEKILSQFPPEEVSAGVQVDDSKVLTAIFYQSSESSESGDDNPDYSNFVSSEVSDSEFDDEEEAVIMVYPNFSSDKKLNRKHKTVVVHYPAKNPEIYAKFLSKVRPHVSRTKKSFNILAKSRPVDVYGLKNGKLDTTKLVDAKLGSDTIYKERLSKSRGKFVVVILIDQSGSMEGRKIRMAAEAALLLYKALVDVCPLFIYGHTSDMDCTTNDCETDIFVYAEGKPVNEQIFGSITDYSYNRDGTAIRYVVDRVRQATNLPGYLIVISDGYPNGAIEYEGKAACEDTRLAVNYAKHQKLLPLQLAIENLSNPPVVMFENQIQHTNIETLPNKLAETISNLIKKNKVLIS